MESSVAGLFLSESGRQRPGCVFMIRDRMVIPCSSGMTDPCVRPMRIPFILLLLFLLIACQAQPRTSIDGVETREVSGQEADLPANARYFVVDSTASELRIVVYPDGPLARLGHAHVIGGPVISGRVALADSWQASALRLSVDVEGLEVDRPEWRRDEGFERDPSESAIAGTRENMRSEAVLDVGRFPSIEIESLGLRGPQWQPDMDLRIRLRGETRELTVPMALSISDDRIVASGQLSLRQSDFGMTPFSVAGGQLAVADQMLVRFRIVAKPGGQRP